MKAVDGRVLLLLVFPTDAAALMAASELTAPPALTGVLCTNLSVVVEGVLAALVAEITQRDRDIINKCARFTRPAMRIAYQST